MSKPQKLTPEEKEILNNWTIKGLNLPPGEMKEPSEQEMEILVKLFGTREERLARAEKHRALEAMLRAKENELAATHPHQYVVVHESGEFFVAETHEAALNWGDAQGYERSDIKTGYILAEDEEIVLRPMPVVRKRRKPFIGNQPDFHNP